MLITSVFSLSEYCKTRSFPTVTKSEYLNTIGEKLQPEIDILWTGNIYVHCIYLAVPLCLLGCTQMHFHTLPPYQAPFFCILCTMLQLICLCVVAFYSPNANRFLCFRGQSYISSYNSRVNFGTFKSDQKEASDMG